MLTAIVIILFLTAMCVEHMTILKGAEKKVKIIHFSLMLVSFCVLMLYSMNVSFPSLTSFITRTIDAIFKLQG